MARPTKAVELRTGHVTKEELKNRKEAEEKLKGNDDKLEPSKYLTAKQKKIFNFIVNEMSVSGIVGNLDVYVLNNCAIAIDRLNTLEEEANKNPALIYDDKFLKARKEYTSTFNKSCQELCLSPASRAKMGNMTVQKQQTNNDPVLNALKAIKKAGGNTQC